MTFDLNKILNKRTMHQKTFKFNIAEAGFGLSNMLHVVCVLVQAPRGGIVSIRAREVYPIFLWSHGPGGLENGGCQAGKWSDFLESSQKL